MFKRVTYNTYIGKSKICIVKDGKFIESTTLIGEIAQPMYPLDLKPSIKVPDYYIRGLYINGTQDDPAEIFQVVDPGEVCTHYLFITGIPKGAKSLDPFKLNNCVRSSYYEDNLHGFLFQILKFNQKISKQI